MTIILMLAVELNYSAFPEYQPGESTATVILHTLTSMVQNSRFQVQTRIDFLEKTSMTKTFHVLCVSLLDDLRW